MGNKEVTEIGIASVIHQVAIQKVPARIALPASLKPSNFMK